MEELENYILSGAFFLILCLLWFVWRMRKGKVEKSSSSHLVLDTLELARSQYEIFNMKPLASQEARQGITAMLHAVDLKSLVFEVNDYISPDLQSSEVDVYFRVKREEGPVFYVFRSVIRKIDSDYANSRLVLSFPQNLRIEKKRHFIRVQPDRNDVRIVGVWPLEPGKKLPKSTDDIGSPVTHFKSGMKDVPVQLENVSASGLALRFRLNAEGQAPLPWKIGGQLLCLVVYDGGGDSDKPTAFWCTGEIMNSRQADGGKPSLVLGLEFTNWAVLEQGKGEIHWAHSSPSRGAKPIMQWVENIEKRKTDTVEAAQEKI